MSQHDDRRAILTRIHKALRVKAPKLSEKHGNIDGENAAQQPHAQPTLGRESVANTPPLQQEQAPLKGRELEPQALEFTNQLPILNNSTPSDFQQWLPLVGESFEERARIFSANSDELKTEFFMCADETDMLARLQGLKTECNWTRVASHAGELTNRVLDALQLPQILTDGGYDVMELEKCDVGITECEALIAQTGSVLVTSKSSGGRALSVLPPHHVVVARRDQMLPDLTEALALLRRKYGENFPTMISFITGPSRTGDIERILVLGAHGPKRLTVLCF